MIWENPDAPSPIALDELNFAQPLPDDDEGMFQTEVRTFDAERYGGRGVGVNGGGARCGLLRGVQVKGIGRNPVSGKSADFWHAHGSASIEEAIREAIWGELCDRVLPFGGVRTHAILDTSTNSFFENGSRRLPRALIVRQAAIRPAHFMRAINFDPGEQMAGAVGDAQRTRDAVQAIGRALPLAPGIDRDGDPHALPEGLREMTRRFAHQLACSFARRIPHGAVNCSNIALDGRLLDYETITAIPDYGRFIVARGNPDIWNQPSSLVSTLVNLNFYLRSYLPAPAAAALPATEELIELLQRTYQGRLKIEFAMLLGFAAPDLEQMAPELLDEFHACAMAVIGPGNGEPFKIPQMPQVTGRFHLCSLLSACALSSDDTLDARIAPLLPDDRLRGRLGRVFVRMRRHHASLANGPQHDAARHMAARSLRLNTDAKRLRHPEMEAEIIRQVDAHPDRSWVPAYVAELLRYGCTRLAATGDTPPPAWFAENVHIAGVPDGGAAWVHQWIARHQEGARPWH